MTGDGKFQLGILDLGPPEHAFLIATRAQELGYSRYWLSEHHGENANCGSPTVMTALLAGMTTSIRVGPAGILLSYNSPLKVAEEYRLLSLLFPGRIDLGIARATTTGATHQALLDGRVLRPEDHDARVETLIGLVRNDLPPDHPAFAARVVPVHDNEPPELWVLGSSERSVAIAARLGAAFCLSEHLAVMRSRLDSDVGVRAIEQYRARFVPSRYLSSPQWAVCVAGVCAESSSAATGAIPDWSDGFRATLIGTPDDCLNQLQTLQARYGTQQIIFAGLASTAAARIRSYELLAEACGLRRS
jgi:luciferase family oxidoreductase group 1